MAVNDDIEQKIDESNLILQGITKTSNKILEASEKIKDKAIKQSVKLNNIKPAYTAATLVGKAVDDDLQSVIKDTKKSYKDFVGATESYLSDYYSIKLTKKDLEIIAKKGSELITNLVGNTNILKQDIQYILTQNLAKGVPEKQLVESFKSLYPAYSRNASTIINTGLGRIFVDTNVSKFEEENFEWYLWAGPKDLVTREFPCIHWVWHRFPASQLAKITAVRLGLWNCRHSIIPLTTSQIEQYAIGNLSYAPK